MGMTPSDVEQKTFSTALRGYDLDEVDDFLDEVISTIRDLQDQIADAKSKKSSKPVADGKPAEDESAIGRVLITAQTTADTMIADAREEADRILAEAREEADRNLADARSEADSWADEREAKKTAAEEEMAELTRHVGSVRTQLAVLATVVADRLDEMDESIGGQDQTDQDLDVSPDADEDSSDRTDSYAIDDDSGDEGDDDPGHGSDVGSVEDEEEDDIDDDSESAGDFSSREEDDRDTLG